MGGWEFLERLGKLEGIPAFPRIYIVSSFETTEDIERAMNHPLVFGYYTKPLSGENLSHMVRAFEQEKEC